MRGPPRGARRRRNLNLVRHLKYGSTEPFPISHSLPHFCLANRPLTPAHFAFDRMIYFWHMDETKIEERFNQLEKRVSDGFVRMEDGFSRLETLIETLANSTAREFAAI